jgi:hypothetical protein
MEAEVLWFFCGLGVGLLADLVLVLHMLKPIKERVSHLETENNISKAMEAMDD